MSVKMWEFFQDVAGFVLGILYILGHWLSITYEAGRLWAFENSEIVYGFGAAIIACGLVALMLRAVWQRWLRDKVKPLYWKLIQRPMHRVLAPVRRLHRRWSVRNMEKKMAKWKQGALADIVGDALLEANVIGIISDQEYRAYMQKAGKALGLPDLVRVTNNKLAIAHRVKTNKTHEASPKGKIPGGKPGENVVPQFVGIGDRFLRKHKKTA